MEGVGGKGGKDPTLGTLLSVETNWVLLLLLLVLVLWVRGEERTGAVADLSRMAPLLNGEVT